MHQKAGILLAATALALAASGIGGHAQDAESFFRGKTMTLYAGSTPGGGVDLYARLLAQHLPDHIAGHPTIIVQDQPGAGSLVAAHNLYSVAPKDGTQLAVTLPGALFDPLMNGRDLAKYDPRKFNYLGNANSDATVCVTRRDAPVQDYSQVFSKQLVLAATGPGSVSLENPLVERNLLGAKMKIVSGYPGSNEIRLAIYSKEVQGVCGEQWSSAKQQFPDALRPDGATRILAEEDSVANPVLEKMGVPLVVKFSKTAEQKRILDLFFLQGSVSRPFMLPPGVPSARVSMLRRAFDETMRDPGLLADAAKAHLDINYKSGQETQALMNSIYGAPAELIQKMRKASVM